MVHAVVLSLVLTLTQAVAGNLELGLARGTRARQGELHEPPSWRDMTDHYPLSDDDEGGDAELEFLEIVEETSCCAGLTIGVQIERVLTSGLCSRRIRPDLHRFFGHLRALRVEVVLTTELPMMLAADLVGELLDGHVPQWIAGTLISSRRDGASRVRELGGPGRCFLVDAQLPTSESDLLAWLPAPAWKRSSSAPVRPLNTTIRALKNAAIMMPPAFPLRLSYEVRCVAAAVAWLGAKQADSWLKSPCAHTEGQAPQDYAGSSLTALWQAVRALHTLPSA